VIEHNRIRQNSAVAHTWVSPPWPDPPYRAPSGLGGGIWNCDGPVRDNVISGNIVVGYGAGLADCDGTIERNVITGNEAEGKVPTNGLDPSGLEVATGGGLYRCNGPISHNTITNNRASAAGGGIYSCEGKIENNWIAFNLGGGVHGTSGTLHGNEIEGNVGRGVRGFTGRICDNTIKDNIGGGLSYCRGEIAGNLIADNWTTGIGAGLYECEGTIRNNVVARNRATGFLVSGGGLFACEALIINNTIVGNSATEAGGGLYRCRDAEIINCIIWGNEAPEGAQFDDGSTPTYSCIEDFVAGGVGNFGAAPRLVGPEDYHLRAGSPCIDSGTSSPCPATDFDGVARPVDGDGDGRTVCDVGAYEFLPLPPAPNLVAGGSFEALGVGIGSRMSVSVEILNEGELPAGSFWNHLYLSADERHDPVDHLWVSGIRSPPLAAGETFDWSGAVSKPKLPAGEYHVLVQCDVMNEVAERYEDDNIADIAIIKIPTGVLHWKVYR
jgi:hypothetical protein